MLAVEFADRIAAGISEYYSLIVFALAGMLFAASSNNFAMLFVSIELITITFYVLTSFTRGKVAALESGVKYLILGALSSAFMVYGIALVWGDGQIQLQRTGGGVAELRRKQSLPVRRAVHPRRAGLQDRGVSVPDVDAGCLSRRACAHHGFPRHRLEKRRVCFAAAFPVHGHPSVTAHWDKLLIVVSAITILYGNLCAIPQRNLKRLLGYSSISHAGYLLLGVAALTTAGQAAVLYYLSGYLFTTLAAFAVIVIVLRHLDSEDIGGWRACINVRRCWRQR